MTGHGISAGETLGLLALFGVSAVPWWGWVLVALLVTLAVLYAIPRTRPVARYLLWGFIGLVAVVAAIALRRRPVKTPAYVAGNTHTEVYNAETTALQTAHQELRALALESDPARRTERTRAWLRARARTSADARRQQ